VSQEASRYLCLSVLLAPLFTLYLLVTLGIKENPKTYDANRETGKSKPNEVKQKFLVTQFRR